MDSRKSSATGAELFVGTLAQLGIDRIFTLVGDHLNEVLQVAAQRGIHILDVRHESGATHAADAWARLHRAPALSLVTGGPGHSNSLTGIAAAQLAGSPLIAVSGSRSSAQAERGAFQDIDQVGMARPITKWSAAVQHPNDIPFFLSRAYGEANSGRRGAVHLSIPVDLFAATTHTRTPVSISRAISSPAPSPVQVAEAIALLRSATRPVVIAGSGAWWAGAGPELIQFAESTHLPVFTIGLARGLMPDSHPLCLGYADPALNWAARDSLREADVVLIIGKRLDYRLAMGGSRVFSSEARFIQIDIHQPELGLNRPLEVAILADAKGALRSLINASPAANFGPPAWLSRLHERQQDWQRQLHQHSLDTGSPLHPAAFYAELQKSLPPNVCYSWDGGDFVHWGRCMLPALVPGGWLRLGGLGAIGSGLPNGIAMQMALPDRRVIVFTGDGSLGFYLAELDTAVRHNLPLIVIVGNDGGWGLERELQSQHNTSTVACELLRTRYDLIAEGFGGAGELVETLDQVQPALSRALASQRPYCMNVMIRGVRSPFTVHQLTSRQPRITG